MLLRDLLSFNSNSSKYNVKLRYLLNTILLISSITLWVSSIIEARVNLAQGISDLGLFSVLPLTFYIAFSLLTFSFLLSINSGQKLFIFCTVSLLIIFIDLSPFLIEGTPRLTWSYVNYRSVDYISQTSVIDPAAQWIHNWPGFSIFFSTFVQITGLSPELILSIYPTFYNFLFLLPLYIFFRLIIKNNTAIWLSIWIFYVANWVGQDYFSMQSMAMFFFILILFLLFNFIKNKRIRNRTWLIPLCLLFSFVTISHMLTSLIVLSVLLVFYLFNQLKKPAILLTFVTIFLSWTIFNAVTYLQQKSGVLIDGLFNFSQILRTSITSRIAGSPEHIFVSQTRIAFTAIFISFALIGLFLTWKSHKLDFIDKNLLAVLISTVLLLGFVPYGGEILMRVFFFSLVPVCYFICKSFKRKLLFGFFSVFLIIAVPGLHIATHFGNESMDYVPQSELQGNAFIKKVSFHSNIIGPGIRWSERTRDFQYNEFYSYYAFSNVQWKNDKLSVLVNQIIHPDWMNYVVISYGVTSFYNFYPVEDSETVVEINKNVTQSIFYDKIYSNPSFQIYVELSSG